MNLLQIFVRVFVCSVRRLLAKSGSESGLNDERRSTEGAPKDVNDLDPRRGDLMNPFWASFYRRGASKYEGLLNTWHSIQHDIGVSKHMIDSKWFPVGSWNSWNSWNSWVSANMHGRAIRKASLKTPLGPSRKVEKMFEAHMPMRLLLHSPCELRVQPITRKHKFVVFCADAPVHRISLLSLLLTELLNNGTCMNRPNTMRYAD